ncbi:MAG: DUF721 domain-containing protein [Gammaproteobacteria bacterium]|nr:DUF721 domain-containing protein [Gammaproteobacteria bacterium]
MTSAKQINTLLSKLKQTSHMFKQIEHEKRLTQNLRALLPSPLAENCQAGGIKNDTLIIFTTSAVWASKLRYLIPTLLADFSEHPKFQQVTEINIKINQSTKQPETKGANKNRLTLSMESAELIRQTAESIHDPELRESLLKLSQKGMKKPS